MQIVQHLRQQILDGVLRDGDLVPSVRQIAKDWNVSRVTAARVLTTLASEGVVRSAVGVGTVVTTAEAKHAPADRVASMRRTGRFYPPNERAKIQTAELVPAPAEVADALGVPHEAQVVRRHRITYRDELPISASTSWFTGDLADTAPLLLKKTRIRQGTPVYIEEQTGRAATMGRDQLTARTATKAEADELGIPAGTPVLAARNWVYDQDGAVLEYGESISAPGRWKSYDYEVLHAQG